MKSVELGPLLIKEILLGQTAILAFNSSSVKVQQTWKMEAAFQRQILRLLLLDVLGTSFVPFFHCEISGLLITASLANLRKLCYSSAVLSCCPNIDILCLYPLLNSGGQDEKQRYGLKHPLPKASEVFYYFF